MRPRAFESLQEEVKRRMHEDQAVGRLAEATVSEKRDENPVPIQEESRENPVPIRKEAESEPGIETILSGLSDDHLDSLAKKFTKNDGRWGRMKKIEELVHAEITIAQVYEGRE